MEMRQSRISSVTAWGGLVAAAVTIAHLGVSLSRQSPRWFLDVTTGSGVALLLAWIILAGLGGAAGVTILANRRRRMSDESVQMYYDVLHGGLILFWCLVCMGGYARGYADLLLYASYVPRWGAMVSHVLVQFLFGTAFTVMCLCLTVIGTRRAPRWRAAQHLIPLLAATDVLLLLASSLVVVTQVDI